MNLRSFAVIVCLQLSLLVVAQNEKQEQIDRFILQPGLQHASIGFCVKDFSGNVLANHNMDRSYTPASILKIITTATVFEVLGADYRYETTLAVDNENANRLLIHGTGDPTLGTEHLDKTDQDFVDRWADEIDKAFAGKKEIEILVVDNYFGYRGVSRKWIHEDLGNYYAAASYGISVFDNTYRLSFRTKGLGSQPEIIETKPTMKNLKFTNTLRVNTSGRDDGYVLGAPFSNERTIIGSIPANRTKFSIKGDIPNPGLYLGDILADAMTNRGLNTKNIATSYDAYHKQMYSDKHTAYEGSVFYVHQSPALSTIARQINEKSNNHYAEHLIRTIGRKYNKDIYSLALEEGIEQVNELWKERGLQTEALFMYDGCGLAPTNALSAELMTDVLLYMQTKSQNAIAFLNSMPKAGQEGTVRSFLRGTKLDGKVYVKSGSIADSQCFAGYYIDGDKKYAFTIMVNKFDAPRNQVVKAVEKLLLGILQ